ncbi:MAG TPA: hypothetical protein VHC98_00085 [Candidatus Saccharimonadales bacterium]|nr:hypothetical protein [Candidatus Saccharimonadales bacterium]
MSEKLGAWQPDFEINARTVAAQFEVDPEPVHERWAAAMPPVHGCRYNDALRIISEGEIKPYTNLRPRLPNGLPSPYLTDQLDIQLGQHAFTFWNIGKVAPLEVFPVYFCARPELARRDDALVAMKDIAELGALVSPEAQQAYEQYHPGESVELINQDAATAFFQSVVKGKDFRSIFARFLATHYPSIGETAEGGGPTESGAAYWRDLTYPNEQLQFRFFGDTMQPNTWNGPQLQLARPVKLRDIWAIIVTDPAITQLPGLKRHKHIALHRAPAAAQQAVDTSNLPPAARTVERNSGRSTATNWLLYQFAHSNLQQQPRRER